MLQIEGNTIQERFISAVKSLKLRFPGRTIAEKTGYNKGTISEYLRNKEPSEAFIQTFSEHFGLNFKAIWEGVYENMEQQHEKADPSAMQILAVLADAFRDQAALMKNIESKMAREDTQATIEKEVKGLATNLNVAQADIEKISLVQDRTEKVLNYLAELTAGKNPPSKGSDKQKHGIDGDGRKQGKSPA